MSWNTTIETNLNKAQEPLDYPEVLVQYLTIYANSDLPPCVRVN